MESAPPSKSNFNFIKVEGTDDLVRFIDGGIGFEEIQDYIKEDVSVQDAIMNAYK